MLALIWKKLQKEFPETEEWQIWLLVDDIVDRYCTPIIILVTDVSDDIVSYETNYSNTVKEKNINTFKEQYTFQN